MCGTCGCSGEAVVTLVAGPPDHAHHEHGGHSGGEGDSHVHLPAGGDSARTVQLQQRVLARNDDLAAANRQWLAARAITAVNVMSSPGAGKTTLLARTARELAGEREICVIEGDQETTLDAGRIRDAGCRVVQVNTGAGCHLEAGMVGQALRALDPPGGSLLIIENVGNLVCPGLFDLGEDARVVIGSVTEGADKPAKYPHMYRQADLVLLNKTDLLPYLDFDTAGYERDLTLVAPRAALLHVSAVSGDGLPGWYDWLRSRSRDAAATAR
jgi:hydrogenase nickel incorporation protein HypB